MNSEDNILCTNHLQFKGDFGDQVQEILNFVKLTPECVHNLQHLYDDLERVLQSIAPRCKIVPFGSIPTGLGIKTSDVDCFVALPDGHRPNAQYVILARNILNDYPTIFSKIRAIPLAKVPIVKFFHIPTQRQCDVNFVSLAAVRNTKLIAFLMHWDERVLPLVTLIKYWSKVHKFTGTNLLFGNYTLILMLIFYLQLKNILPSVYELQRNVRGNYIDYWNTAFDENMTCREVRNSDTLYELLGGFFSWFNTYNFKDDIISPFLGRVISKERFHNINLPDEFALYKNLIVRGMSKQLTTTSHICVQDPFDHSQNCSFSFDRLLWDKFLILSQRASKKFYENQGNNFLKAIFTVDPNSSSTTPGTVTSELT